MARRVAATERTLVSEVDGSSRHPLSSIKTYHYQAQLIEKCTVPL